MAGKKMKKAASAKDACCRCNSGFGNLEEWIMLLLGATGLLNALGLLEMPIYFSYVWSIVIIFLAMKRLIDRSSCGC